MPRIKRIDVGGEVYHVLNRANARAQIFYNEKDYQQFKEILEEAIEKYEGNGVSHHFKEITRTRNHRYFQTFPFLHCRNE